MRRLSNFIQLSLKFDLYLSKIEEILLVSILTSMVFFSFLQVVLRNIFSSGIPWADIFLRHLVLWIAFIGAALTTRSEKHISIDILSRFLGEKLNVLRKLLINAVSGTVGYFLIRASWTFYVDEKMAGTEIFPGIPTWYFLIILPITLTIITFRFYLKALSETVEIFTIKKVQSVE